MDFHTPWHTKLVPFTLRSPCVSRSRDHLLGRCGWWCSRGGTADHTHGTPAASQGEGALSWEWMRVVILCQWFIGLHASVDTFQLKTCKGGQVVFIPWLTEVYQPPQLFESFDHFRCRRFLDGLRGLIHPKFGELCPIFGWNTWAQQGDASPVHWFQIAVAGDASLWTSLLSSFHRGFGAITLRCLRQKGLGSAAHIP